MVSNVAVTVGPDNQIVVRAGDIIRRGDVWYLGIAEAGPGSPDDVRRLVAELVATWIRCVTDLPDGSVAWLPFDLSDESTRWIACRRRGDVLELEFGWSAVEGWAIRPFDSSTFAAAAATFRPDATVGESLAVYRPLFLSRLRSSVAALTDAAQGRGISKTS